MDILSTFGFTAVIWMTGFALPDSRYQKDQFVRTLDAEKIARYRLPPTEDIYLCTK